MYRNLMFSRYGISNQCMKDGMWRQESHNNSSNKSHQDSRLFIQEKLLNEQIPSILTIYQINIGRWRMMP